MFVGVRRQRSECVINDVEAGLLLKNIGFQELVTNLAPPPKAEISIFTLDSHPIMG